jgi:Trp operon repressor
MWESIKQRIAPFLDLLDARYLPLLFVAAPQAYTVYAWLLADGAPSAIALMGGIGFEFVYVGAIAWAAKGAGWHAARVPAVTALIFSVAVAVAHYGAVNGALAILHAGFPLVGYAYMVMMHAPVVPSRNAVQQAEAQAAHALERAAQAEREAAHAALALAQAEADAAQWREALALAEDRATQSEEAASQLREVAAQAEAGEAQLKARVARRMIDGGASQREAARLLDVSDSTLRRWLGSVASAAD